jgi:hypothetical protein
LERATLLLIDKAMTHYSSEEFGNLPNPSATFGTVPNDSESFRSVRTASERTESHTLTVREVARLFEQAGVSRTERSIINWCCRNRQGVARLDAFFDENERRYYITPQSVSRAVEEESAKQSMSALADTDSEVRNRSERSSDGNSEHLVRVKDLERQNRDLEIATRAKDFYVEQLESERGQFVERLIGMSRYVGELQTQVLQLGGAPRGDKTLPQHSESFDKTPHVSEPAHQHTGYPQGGFAV